MRTAADKGISRPIIAGRMGGPSFHAKSVPELIAYAKANPVKISVGAPTGTPPHL